MGTVQVKWAKVEFTNEISLKGSVKQAAIATRFVSYQMGEYNPLLSFSDISKQ